MNGGRNRGAATVAWVALGLALGGYACGENPGDGLASSPGDSQYSLEADLRIGTADSPEPDQFFRIADVDVDESGNIWVLDRGDNNVRAFDPTGRQLLRFGRAGNGPGELSRPSRIAVARDTVLVVGTRLNFFTTSGKPLRSWQYDFRNVGSSVAVVGTPTGWVFVMRRQYAEPVPTEERRRTRRRGPYQNGLSVRRIDPATLELGEPVLSHDGAEFYLLGDLGWGESAVFAPEGRIALSRSGRIYTTAGDDYSIDPFDPDGTPLRSIRHSVERIPVTQADLDESYRTLTEPLRARRPGSELDEHLEALEQEYPGLPRPEFRPVVGRLLAAPDGSLLVERLDLDPQPFVNGDTSAWDYLAPDGSILGRVTVPGRATPRRLVDGCVYAVVLDELDVQSVIRWRLVRQPPG